MNKRIIIVLTSLLLVLALCFSASAAGVKGDVDGDGNIKSADARLALRRAVNLESFPEDSEQFYACDVDWDGKVTAADARLILRVAVNLDEFPANPNGEETTVPEETTAVLPEETTVSPEVTTEPEATTVPAEVPTEPEVTTEPEKTTEAETTTAPEVTTEKETTTLPEETTTADHEHEHSFENPTVTKAATCTEDGVKTSTCSCGEVKTEGIKATGHTPGADATCTSAQVCTVCKEQLRAALGHDYVAHTAKAATCTEKGWDEYRTCSRCDYTTYKEIAATGHKNVTDKAVAATCTKDGLTAGTHCSVCNTVTKAQTVVKATGHSAVTDKAVAATCTKTGLTEGSHCSVCNTVIKAQTVVKATGHSAVTDKAVAADCTKTGLTEGSHCSVCNTVLVAQQTVAKTGHTWDAGKVTTAATCTAEGVKTFTCKVCKTTKTEIIAKAEHTVVIDEGKAPCVNTGLTEGSHCSVCNTVLVAQEEIPATGEHNWSTGTITQPASCLENEIQYRYCTTCSTMKTDSIVEKENTKLGHIWSTAQTVAPTCTEEGYSWRTCTRVSKDSEGNDVVCGAVEKFDIVEATGHKYTWTVVKESTCTEAGEKSGVCSVCGNTTTEKMPLEDHQYNRNSSKDIKGDCDNTTKYTMECSACGDSYIKDTGAYVHGRKNNGASLKATCEAAGYDVCSTCGKHMKEYAATGHSISGDMNITATRTCTTDGKAIVSGTCKTCGESFADTEITLPAQGHNINETNCQCSVCYQSFHDFDVENTVFSGAKVAGFICKNCHKVDTSAETFNRVVNLIKKSSYPSSHLISYFSTSTTQTTYTKFDFGMWTNTVKDLYDSELGVPTTDYSALRKDVYLYNALPIDANTISKITNTDVDSITVERVQFNSNDILSAYPDSYTLGSRTYDLAQFKNIAVSGGVLKVTVDVKDELLKKSGGNVNYNSAENTHLMNIMNYDIRSDLKDFDSNWRHVESEGGDGYSITMDMTLNSSSTDAKIVYYFREDTLEPIAAVYTLNRVQKQSISMKFTIGLSISGEIDPQIISSDVSVYFFSGLHN